MRRDKRIENGMSEECVAVTGADEPSVKRTWRDRLPAIPLTFLGLGIYRAWIEIVFVGSFVHYPAATFTLRDTFDFTTSGMLLICMLLAKRIGPLYRRKPVFVASAVMLTLSTCGMFASIWAPEYASLLGLPCALLGGAGIGFTILLWSELYGCLNPLRVAMYYSASIIVGALVIYIFEGFKLPWLFTLTMLLPLISLALVRHSFGQLPKAELPSTTWVRFSVPWKAVLMMALYAFAYGTLEQPLYSSFFGPHSAPGTVIVACVVFGGVLMLGDKFDFNIIYRMALPLMIVALLIIPSLGFSGAAVSNLCISGGYTAMAILIMLICSNICYRYGVSAVWLFGIERGVRILLMCLGRMLSWAAGTFALGAIDGTYVVGAIGICAVLGGTLVFLSERDLSSRWGATFLDQTAATREIVQKQEVADRCHALASEYGLTTRESEVLLLLAQHKTVGIIERELFIANGTAKAHIRHIYQKLDIHSREELFEKLAIDGLQPLD